MKSSPGKKNFYLILFLIFWIVPLSSQDSIDTEEILVAFYCQKDNLLLKPSILEWYNEEKSRLERESGKIYFLNLLKGLEGGESMVEEFTFRNGSFAVLHAPSTDTFLPPSHNNHRFIIYKYPQNFNFNNIPTPEEWNPNLHTPLYIHIYPDGVPGNFRRFRNHIFTTCPFLKNQWYVFRMVFRNKVMIRFHWNSVESKNHYGDFVDND